MGHDVEILAGGQGPFIKILEKEGFVVTPIKSLMRHISATKDYACLS